ncbi:MAG: hypothetical protein WC371_02490 [Parachlamydiales bacterium]|jgi:hypothetical protein
MQNGYVLKTLAIFGSALLLVYGGFIATSFLHKGQSQNHSSMEISYAKTTLNPENPVQVEISLKDDLSAPNETLEEVFFNQKKIPLKKADEFGKRGNLLLQMQPGNYLLYWKVKSTQHGPAKITKYSKEIILKGSRPWVHILIKGAQITITN